MEENSHHERIHVKSTFHGWKSDAENLNFAVDSAIVFSQSPSLGSVLCISFSSYILLLSCALYCFSLNIYFDNFACSAAAFYSAWWSCCCLVSLCFRCSVWLVAIPLVLPLVPVRTCCLVMLWCCLGLHKHPTLFLPIPGRFNQARPLQVNCTWLLLEFRMKTSHYYKWLINQ